MKKENNFSKEKSAIFSITSSLSIIFIMIGLVYVLPDELGLYLLYGYSIFLNAMCVIYLFFYLFSFDSDGFVDRVIDKSVKKHIENKDSLFIKRALNPNRAIILGAFLSSLLLIGGVIVGNMVGSSYVMGSMAIWACTHFLTVDRVYTKLYRNHREDFLKFINNNQST